MEEGKEESEEPEESGTLQKYGPQNQVPGTHEGSQNQGAWISLINVLCIYDMVECLAVCS